jgi:hypothetical protein
MALTHSQEKKDELQHAQIHVIWKSIQNGNDCEHKHIRPGRGNCLRGPLEEICQLAEFDITIDHSDDQSSENFNILQSLVDENAELASGRRETFLRDKDPRKMYWVIDSAALE